MFTAEQTNDVADHDSRGQPWPVVSAFLSSIPTGWVGLDSGTGNGKYLPLPLDRPGGSWTVGLDRSTNLLSFARSAGGKAREVVLGDAMKCCWRNGIFVCSFHFSFMQEPDGGKRIMPSPLQPFTISLPQKEENGQSRSAIEVFFFLTLSNSVAVQSLLRCLSPSHGRALIYVWATQQDELSKRSIPLASTNSSMEHESQSEALGGTGKDVFVPWTLTSGARAGDFGLQPSNASSDH